MSEAAPAGHVWLQSAGTLRLINTGNPRHEEEEEARRRHRENWEAAEAERLAVEAHDARIASRVAAETSAPPCDLIAGTSGLSPARSALVTCLSWISHARAQSDAAVEKLRVCTGASARAAAAQSALDDLDREVAQGFSEWIRFNSAVPRPAERSAERAEIAEELAAASPLAKFEQGATFECECASAVVQELEGRLPSLRDAVLVEACLPLTLEVRDLCDQLREKFVVLASLAQVTGTGSKTVKCALPAVPFGGPVGFEIGAADTKREVEAWLAALTALEQDPRCSIEVPGQDAAPVERIPMLSWAGVKEAWRSAR
jgi:hypothetical protein